MIGQKDVNFADSKKFDWTASQQAQVAKNIPIFAFFTIHMDIFNWSINYYSKLIACFFYGYALGVGPMGMFADVFGARYLIGLRQNFELSANFF